MNQMFDYVDGWVAQKQTPQRMKCETNQDETASIHFPL